MKGVQLSKAAHGPDYPLTLELMNTLALAYEDAGRFDDAVRLEEETVKLSKAKLGPDHPETSPTPAI